MKPSKSSPRRIGIISAAVTPMFARYSVYITDAPRIVQNVMSSGASRSGFSNGTSSASPPETSCNGLIQIFLKISRAGSGISSGG